MADQIEIFLPVTRIDERTQLTATVRFRQRSDNSASIPTTIHYRLYNWQQHEVVRDWTQVTPAAAEVTITLDARDLKIRDNTHQMERHGLTVVADRGLATQATAEKNFQIRNVGGWDESLDN